MPNLLRLNLQFFSEVEAPQETSWSEYLSEQISEVADDQPEVESETEEVVEDSEEVIEDTVEPDNDEEETEEVEEEEPLFNDDTEIELGEDRKPVKLSELKSGYLRQSDYTKKTQALAEERKTFESEKEQYEPVKNWLGYIESNPYLFQRVQEAISTWNNLGEFPSLSEVLDTEAGPYVNQLLTQVKSLQSELDQIKGEYQTTKFDSEMTSLLNDLKAEYGELLTPDYEQSLRKQAEDEGLSADVLKRIAKGDLAELKLQQATKDSKKQEAKTVQKLRERKLPPQPKSKGQKPAHEPPTLDGSWSEFFSRVGG